MNTIISRLHEQREYPEKSIRVTLTKGLQIEELDWERKTEETKIYKRMFLEKWFWKKDKKFKYLHLIFNKEDLAKAKKRRQKIIDNILAKYYDELALSFTDHLVSSTLVKLELGFLDKEQIIKTFGKAIEKGSKEKDKVVEINGQKRKRIKKDKAKTAKKPKKNKNKKRTN